MPQDEPQDARLQNEMSQDAYKHISIENAEEEVFVVGAGCVTNDPTSCQQFSKESSATSARASKDASKDSSKDSSKDTYEQTSDDLRAEPMPLLQKIIIAAAVAGVIVLVAYLIFSFQA